MTSEARSTGDSSTLTHTSTFSTNFSVLASHISTWVRDRNTSIFFAVVARSAFFLAHTIVWDRDTDSVVASGIVWAGDTCAGGHSHTFSVLTSFRCGTSSRNGFARRVVIILDEGSLAGFAWTIVVDVLTSGSNTADGGDERIWALIVGATRRRGPSQGAVISDNLRLFDAAESIKFPIAKSIFTSIRRIAAGNFSTGSISALSSITNFVSWACN